jgi:hypothetical protein
MVKNTKGGSSHKKGARKHTVGSNQRAQNKLRISLDECEIYAQVEKLLGGGMCYVNCIDNKKRICVIRGKFRGRGKRDNTLVNGTWCLIGLRDYLSEVADGKFDKCDLLEVYSDSDKARLRSQVTDVDWNKFLATDAANSFTNIDDEAFEFADDSEKTEYKNLMTKQITEGSIASRLDLFTVAEDNEVCGEINIDDI